MNRLTLTFLAKFATALSVIPVLIYANSSGPPARHTGAPGDRTCAAATCHVGAQPGNQVTIAYSEGSTYTPGRRGRFTVTITDTANRAAYGFQATARLAGDLQNGQAGTLHAGPGQIVICENDGLPPCRETAPVQFVEHSVSSSAAAFEFEWTPPAAASGDVRIFVAANAANGNGTNSGDRIHTGSLSLSPAAAGPNRPSVSQGGVVDPWTRKAGIAPGMWVEIYGQNFGTGSTDWSNAIVNGVLPTTLAGVSVTINNRPAAISLVTPGQINALAPADAGTGEAAVVVRTAAGESAPVTIRLNNISPVVFAPIPNGERFTALLVDNATAALYGAPPGVRPARPGDIVQLYALGLGPTTPPLVTDRLLPAPAALVNPPKVRFGDTEAEVLGSALISPGLYQINLRVPDVSGDVRLTIEAGGVISPNDTFILVAR